MSRHQGQSSLTYQYQRGRRKSALLRQGRIGSTKGDCLHKEFPISKTRRKENAKYVVRGMRGKLRPGASKARLCHQAVYIEMAGWQPATHDLESRLMNRLLWECATGIILSILNSTTLNVYRGLGNLLQHRNFEAHLVHPRVA